MLTPIQRSMAIWKTTLEAREVSGRSDQHQLATQVFEPDSPPGERRVYWPLEEIIRHFESEDQSRRIACPDLAPERLSAWAIWKTRSKRNGEKLKKVLAEYNNFMGRAMLGQQGVEISHRCPFVHYIEVKQGEITVLVQDDSTAQSPEFLHAGERRTFPPGAYTVTFKEKTLLTMGGFLPRQDVPKSLKIDLENGSLVNLPTSTRPVKAFAGLCDVCKAIPWDELRTEDGPAHPHHESVGQLIASSDTCRLCDMLVDAIIESEKQREQYDYPVTQKLLEHSTEFREAPTYVSGPADVSDQGPFLTGQQLYKQNGKVVGSVAWRSPLAPGECVKKVPAGGLEPLRRGEWSQRVWVYGNWWCIDLPHNPLPQLIGLGVRLTRDPEMEVLNGSHDIPRYLFRGSQIRLLAPAGLPLHAGIPSRTLYRRQNGEVPAIQLIRGFLDYCDKHHEDVCVSSETKLPTRVLDLSELKTRKVVKLVVSENKRGKHIALSHCWGSTPPLETTSNTFSKHRKGIKMRLLPLIFRQAVTICAKLGIQYLWIDSLCIVQDVMKDREAEADKIHQVYGNAWLTITAMGSDRCYTSKQPPDEYVSYDSRSTGRNQVRRPDVEVQLPDTKIYACMEWMPSSFEKCLSRYQIGTFGANADPLEDEPVSQRGWTLQERFLSPRIVHFTSGQIFLQCGRELMAEDGSRYDDKLSKTTVLESHNRDLNINAETSPSENKYESSRRAGGWEFLVETYSRRQLSLEEDKLAAIAGTARWLEEHTGETYLAGLWKDHMSQDLLWRAYPFEEMQSETSDQSCLHGPGKPFPAFKRPQQYRAPSWSWASIDGSVKFEALSNLVCSSFIFWFPKFYDQRNVFSKPGPGSGIRIKAPLVKVQPSISRVKLFPQTAVNIILTGHAYQGHAWFDFEPKLPCVGAMICKSNCLLLEKVSTEPKLYKRIGLAQTDRVEGSTVNMYEDDKVLEIDLQTMWEFNII